MSPQQEFWQYHITYVLRWKKSVSVNMLFKNKYDIGMKKNPSHAHWYPIAVLFRIFDEHSHPFYMEGVLQGCIAKSDFNSQFTLTLFFYLKLCHTHFISFLYAFLANQSDELGVS